MPDKKVKKVGNSKSISIVIAMRNAATTVIKTLQSIVSQDIKADEIIIIDNKSTDESIKLVENFSAKSPIPIKLIKREVNKGVGASYNLGVEMAKSNYVILMHSDSSLPTNYEITKLLKPFEDKDVIASFSTIILPKQVWETYNFWQKCLLVGAVEKESPGLNGKFDCIRRDIFLEIGGFNIEAFGQEKYMGGEDADLHYRLRQKGKVVLSDARVTHLHYLGKDYKLIDWIGTRKLLARTYGRLLRERKTLHLSDIIFLLAKPFLALLPFVPGFYGIGVSLLILYAVLYPWKMYTFFSTIMDQKIFLLPFIHVFLLYYETFWMAQAFFFRARK